MDLRDTSKEQQPLDDGDGSLQSPPVRPTIVLVRHGEHVHGSLTAVGRREVNTIGRALAQFLRETIRSATPIRLYFTQERDGATETLGTAEILARLLRVEISSTVQGPEQLVYHEDEKGQISVGEFEFSTSAHRRTPMWPNAYAPASTGRAVVKETAELLRRVGENGGVVVMGSRGEGTDALQTRPDPGELDAVDSAGVISGAEQPSASCRPIDATDHGADATASQAAVPGVAVLVGNDPFIGWLAAGLGTAVHLGRGEMAGFEKLTRRWPRPDRWALAWTLCHRNEEAAEELRGKIRSKMDVAKVNGALGVALLTFLLQEGVRGGDAIRGFWPFVALLMIGSGTALYFGTLFAYDRLLMPTRFWSARRPGRTPPWVVRRPPANDVWVLYQNMMHTWRWMFVPACALIAAGLLAVGLAAFPSRPGEAVAILAGVITGAGVWTRVHRPRLGAED